MSGSNLLSLESKLERCSIYRVLREKCQEFARDAEVITLVHQVGNYSVNKLNTIVRNMPEFTLHNEQHVFDMLYIIEKLVPTEIMKQLSIPELMMIIVSVFLHDIGMCPEENTIRAWKGQLCEDEAKLYDAEIEEFRRFRVTYSSQTAEIETLHNHGKHSQAQLLEDYIVTEYIRMTHADRARKLIATDWNGKIKYHGTDLTPELAELCFSHSQDALSLLQMETIKMCDMDIYCCIPFIAVLLRLSDIIDFDAKRTPKILFSHLAVSNPVSLAEWKKHLAINAWAINSKRLLYSAQCEHPAIEATIRGFCDYIDNELRACTLVLSNINSYLADGTMDKYRIPIPTHVDRSKIMAKKDILTGKPIYRYHDTRFTLSKSQVIDLLMGTKLYGKPEVALRELLQNSIDACLLRQKMSEHWGEEYTPRIVVSYYSKENNDYLKVEDNGVGMNQHIIDNYYTNIGNSYYKSREFLDLMAQLNSGFHPISRFGIGILACFMVCDNLEVDTCRVTGKYKCDDPLHISVEGYESLFTITDSSRLEPGTDTTLKLRRTHPWDRMSNSEFIDSVSSLIPRPPFPIIIKTDKAEKTCTPENFEQLDLSPIEDYSWGFDDDVIKKNIRIYEISLDNDEHSFRGNAKIACICKRGVPIQKVEIVSKEIEIDDRSFSLEYSISYGENCIEKHSTNIQVADDGSIESASSYTRIAKSRSLLSIHGINMPCDLFPDYWLTRQALGPIAKLNFPFPILIRLDIGGANDLNLNSARSQIIYDELWQKFEIDLFCIICTALKEKMEIGRWDKLKQALITSIKSDTLADIMKKI